MWRFFVDELVERSRTTVLGLQPLALRRPERLRHGLDPPDAVEEVQLHLARQADRLPRQVLHLERGDLLAVGADEPPPREADGQHRRARRAPPSSG